MEALRGLNRARVDYLLIGLSAINHYAKDEHLVYFTADCDLLLRPTSRNLARAIRAVVAAGYAAEAGGEPLGPVDELICRRIIERRGLVQAKSPGDMPIDLVLETGGGSFADFRGRRRVFLDAGVRVPCMSLDDALNAKRVAGRPKDEAFLKLYEAAMRGEAKPPRRRRRV